MTRKRKTGGAMQGPPRKRVHVVQDIEGTATAVTRANQPPYPEGYPREAPKGDALMALLQLEFKGKVHLICRATETKVDWSRLDNAEVLGMDTETRPNFTKGAAPNPTALLQLATDAECWIFQLLDPVGVSADTRKRLQALLQNPGIIKAGVGIQDDYRDLSSSCLLAMRSAAGVLDLQEIVRPYGLNSTGLRALTAMFLCRRIAKSQQCSDWAQPKLSQSQIYYAAVDAWAGVRLHEILRGVFAGSEAWAPPQRIAITDG